MKKQSGFISILALVALILLLAGGGYLYYQANYKAKPVASGGGTPADKTESTDPYAGWKSYNSAYAKLSFKYPSDWKLSSYEGWDKPEVEPKADAVQLLGPNGLKVSWISYVDGLGGACDDQAVLGTDGACPLLKIVDKTQVSAISGAVVVSGVLTSDGSTYIPWMVVQDAANGILTEQRTLGILAWANAVNASGTAYFGTGGAVSGLVDAAKGTEAKAKSWFGTDEAKQAKLILQSAAL